MPFLAVEGAIDHIARIGEGRGQLPVEVGIVLDDEETQGDSSKSGRRVHDLAAGRVDCQVRDFAIPRQDCQQIDEALFLSAELCVNEPRGRRGRERCRGAEQNRLRQRNSPGRWKSPPAAPDLPRQARASSAAGAGVGQKVAQTVALGRRGSPIKATALKAEPDRDGGRPRNRPVNAA